MSKVNVEWDNRPHIEKVLERWPKNTDINEPVDIPYGHYRYMARWVAYLERLIKEHNDAEYQKSLRNRTKQG